MPVPQSDSAALVARAEAEAVLRPVTAPAQGPAVATAFAARVQDILRAAAELEVVTADPSTEGAADQEIARYGVLLAAHLTTLPAHRVERWFTGNARRGWTVVVEATLLGREVVYIQADGRVQLPRFSIASGSLTLGRRPARVAGLASDVRDRLVSTLAMALEDLDRAAETHQEAERARVYRLRGI